MTNKIHDEHDFQPAYLNRQKKNNLELKKKPRGSYPWSNAKDEAREHRNAQSNKSLEFDLDYFDRSAKKTSATSLNEENDQAKITGQTSLEARQTPASSDDYRNKPAYLNREPSQEKPVDFTEGNDPGEEVSEELNTKPLKAIKYQVPYLKRTGHSDKRKDQAENFWQETTRLNALEEDDLTSEVYEPSLYEKRPITKRRLKVLATENESEETRIREITKRLTKTEDQFLMFEKGGGEINDFR